MSIKVNINDQTFKIHDRFQSLITSVAIGEEFAIWDGPNNGKKVKITRVIIIANDDLTVSQCTIEGTDKNGKFEECQKSDANDEAILFGFNSGNKAVQDTLAYHYAHMKQGSHLEFEQANYLLHNRFTNIVNYDAPLGSGLSSRLTFKMD